MTPMKQNQGWHGRPPRLLGEREARRSMGMINRKRVTLMERVVVDGRLVARPMASVRAPKRGMKQ